MGEEEHGGQRRLASMVNVFHNSMLQAKQQMEQLEHFFSGKIYPAFVHEAESARAEFQRAYQEAHQNWMRERQWLLEEHQAFAQARANAEKMWLQERERDRDQNERERQALLHELERLKAQCTSLLRSRGMDTGPLEKPEMFDHPPQQMPELPSFNTQDENPGVGAASSSTSEHWEQSPKKESFISVTDEDMKPLDHAAMKAWESPFNESEEQRFMPHKKDATPFGYGYDGTLGKGFGGNLDGHGWDLLRFGGSYSKKYVPPARVLKSRLKFGAGGYGKYGIWSS